VQVGSCVLLINGQPGLTVQVGHFENHANMEHDLIAQVYRSADPEKMHTLNRMLFNDPNNLFNENSSGNRRRWGDLACGTVSKVGGAAIFYGKLDYGYKEYYKTPITGRTRADVKIDAALLDRGRAALAARRLAIPYRDQQVRLLDHHPRGQRHAQRGFRGEGGIAARVLATQQLLQIQTRDEIIALRQLEAPRASRQRVQMRRAGRHFRVLDAGHTADAFEQCACIVDRRRMRIDRRIERHAKGQRRHHFPAALQSGGGGQLIRAVGQQREQPRGRHVHPSCAPTLDRRIDELEHFTDRTSDASALRAE
jgi:hypothetical protein